MIVREFWNNPDYIRMELKDAVLIEKEKKEKENRPTISSNRSWLSFVSSQAIGSWKCGYSSYANQFM